MGWLSCCKKMIDLSAMQCKFEQTSRPQTFSYKHRKTLEKSEAIRRVHGSHNIIYPLRSEHNLAYVNVNSAMVNGYDIMRSTFATLTILSGKLNLKWSIGLCEWRSQALCSSWLLVMCRIIACTRLLSGGAFRAEFPHLQNPHSQILCQILKDIQGERFVSLLSISYHLLARKDQNRCYSCPGIPEFTRDLGGLAQKLDPNKHVDDSSSYTMHPKPTLIPK